MTKDNVTKSPWTVVKLRATLLFDKKESYVISIQLANGEKIALLGENAEANARLIVKAVNEYDRNQEVVAEQNKTIRNLTFCHDELVEALKDIIKSHEEIGIPSITLDEKSVIKAKQALSKVGAL